MPTPLERALVATRESRRVVFRAAFDGDAVRKDVAALANSGGGAILFGVDKSGRPIGGEPPRIEIDDFADVEAIETTKFGTRLAALVVGEAVTPIVLDGVVYVRRGARSEPATTDDLAAIVQRRIDAARRDWLGAVRRVVKGAAQPVNVRIVDDRRAPAYRVVDYDKTHPYRQKELLAALRA